MTSNKPDIYTVRDINAAAFLLMKDIPLVEAKKEEGSNLIIFVFEGYKRCRQILDDYYNGRTNENIKKYVDAQRSLRKIINEMKATYEVRGGV